MTSSPPAEDLTSITTLSDAINFIKFLKVSHKAEIDKWTETCKKQAKIIKKLETNRNQELTYLSEQLHKYESDLLQREKYIAEQISEKDDLIEKLNKTIESLHEDIKNCSHDSSKLRSDSCDSGVLADKSDEIPSLLLLADEKKSKRRRPSFKSMNIFRNMDFSPKKKNSESVMVSEKKSCGFGKAAKIWKMREKAEEKTSSDDEESSSEEMAAFLVHRPHKLDESMNNHLCEVPSDNEAEKVFDRVMSRASVRRSVMNPKYQKISRNKSKYLEVLRNTCECTDSSA